MQDSITDEEELNLDIYESYSDDFTNACNSINVDIENILNYKQIEDWIAGERYTFTYILSGYSPKTFNVYYDLDGNVKTIKDNNFINLYERNKTPWKVENYLVSNSIQENLIMWSEDAINSILAFPKTSNFPLFGWVFARFNNIYVVENNVTTKNAFGVKIDSSFRLEFTPSGSLLYGVFDNKVFFGDDSQFAQEIRAVLNPETDDALDKNDEYVYIKEGVLGKYGEKETYDGYASI